jgi:hypothetical protein
MDSTESRYLLDLWARNVCPYCGQKIPKGARVGSGRREEGGFCSLDCYTRYYEHELTERLRRLNDGATTDLAGHSEDE